MPTDTQLLTSTTKCYGLFGGQSIVVWTVTSPKDKKFNLQLRFIQDNAKKIDLTQLTDNLKQYIEKINSVDKLSLSEENARIFFKSLENSGFDITLTELIKDESKIIYGSEEYSYDKNLLALFSLKTIIKKNDNQIRYFGYEMPNKIADSALIPIHSLYIFEGKKLVKKIYLFPSDESSLTTARDTVLGAEDINSLKLDIPFVAYDPKSNNKSYEQEIQTRIDLQTVIAETLTHLKQVKFFRKDNSGKIQIFKEFAKDIAASKPLKEIQKSLNQHDKWEKLSQHRDFFGFFSFFKGKPHSLVAWEDLKNRLEEAFPTDVSATSRCGTT